MNLTDTDVDFSLAVLLDTPDSDLESEITRRLSKGLSREQLVKACDDYELKLKKISQALKEKA